MIDVQQERWLARHYGPQQALELQQSEASHIAPARTLGTQLVAGSGKYRAEAFGT
jgi:hypothetical protein